MVELSEMQENLVIIWSRPKKPNERRGFTCPRLKAALLGSSF
jgi:hypothetical protein